MSPATRTYSWENLAWHARRLRNLDFLVPFAALLFVLYVVFHDML